MADGTDEDGACAARIDEWMIWEVEERSPHGANLHTFSLPVSYLSLCKGGSYPETCAQRTAEGGGSLMSELTGRGPEVGFPLYFLGHISLRDERRCHEN
jgi:hypothetical protein